MLYTSHLTHGVSYLLYICYGTFFKYGPPIWNSTVQDNLSHVEIKWQPGTRKPSVFFLDHPCWGFLGPLLSCTTTERPAYPNSEIVIHLIPISMCSWWFWGNLIWETWDISNILWAAPFKMKYLVSILAFTSSIFAFSYINLKIIVLINLSTVWLVCSWTLKGEHKEL